ncbi:FecR domain-containing protein [Sphingomonas sp. BIUV-7]|uniref:FecR domain-containing protein n=1 Tax=Sphingomonas natans TaxID=3063330 RepID=A0ABT8YAD9_9SPHN|nr:FecR domain-containing protein [Sphingomonas sp. BIUV-7]MDO6414957.1 FecR domain-containing protein [Sphingomonas sp. BIUV-7]
MSRRAALLDAARWTLCEEEHALAEPPPHAADDVQATLHDPALSAALAEMGAIARLSDADVRALRAGRRHAIGTGIVAVLVAVVGIGAWQRTRIAPTGSETRHFETRRGEQRVVRLEDGSTLRLDGATSVDVTLDRRERRVELRRGDAYFDVAHEANRPFVVQAGGSATRVLGTAFTIDLAGQDVRLSVYRGRVRFGGDKGSILVSSGWRSRFASGFARTPTRFDAAQQDWRGSWIDTDDMQLGELVDALNRRAGPLILRPSPGLAAIPLAGRFRLDDAELLLGAMGAAYGFRVEREGDRLRLTGLVDPIARSTPK